MIKRFFAPIAQHRSLKYSVICFCIIFVIINIVRFLFFCLGIIAGFDLINDIMINLLAAFLFFLISQIPETRKRKIIKNNLSKKYIDFKKSVIAEFLILINKSADIELATKLLDIKYFREYFKRNENEKWDEIANNINNNRYAVREILFNLVILKDEISFVLNNIPIHDDKIFVFLKNLSQTIYYLEGADFKNDDLKIFMSFMWQLFSGWSWVTGYPEKDIVQSIIDEI